MERLGGAVKRIDWWEVGAWLGLLVFGALGVIYSFGLLGFGA